jgi:hypothetical protein
VPVTGTIATTGGQTDALTDVELRATPVPVSGTVGVTGTQSDGLTDAELRATAVPVSGTVAVTGTQTDGLTEATFTAEDFATQATLAQVLSKLISNPSTAASQLPDGHAVSVSNDPASIPLLASTASLTSAATLTISPSVGTNALRLWWVSVIPDPDNVDTGYATVGIGSVEAYRAPALAHRQRFDGAAGEDIVVTVVGAGTFLATVHYLEYTP